MSADSSSGSYHSGYYQRAGAYKWVCCKVTDPKAPGCKSGGMKHHPLLFDKHHWLCCKQPHDADGCKSGVSSTAFLAGEGTVTTVAKLGNTKFSSNIESCQLLRGVAVLSPGVLVATDLRPFVGAGNIYRFFSGPMGKRQANEPNVSMALFGEATGLSTLNKPNDVCADPSTGALMIADTKNHRVSAVFLPPCAQVLSNTFLDPNLSAMSNLPRSSWWWGRMLIDTNIAAHAHTHTRTRHYRQVPHWKQRTHGKHKRPAEDCRVRWKGHSWFCRRAQRHGTVQPSVRHRHQQCRGRHRCR